MKLHLSNAEKLLIERRRLGLSQLLAAKKMNVSPFDYGRMERGELPAPSGALSGPLTVAEKCFLYRRRAKQTQRHVAAELGCSRLWVNKMEQGLVPCDDLIWYWES